MIINHIKALEILDSRGRPTVKAKCRLVNGSAGMASVPSGASTGKAEAFELRDGDPGRYGGLGCRKAVNNINTLINEAVSGKDYPSQAAFDLELIRLDGTVNKASLGANAILACSLAFARTMAADQGLNLYEYFGHLIGHKDFALPRPTINLFSGGKHAGQQIPIQDLLIVPVSAQTMDEALARSYAVYQAAAKLSFEKYGMRALTADEGGLAPPFDRVEQMLDDALRSIELAGLEPGKDVALAMDVASSHFHEDGQYNLGNKILDPSAMIDLLKTWVDHYPILSVEDGLAEDDWLNWTTLNETIGKKCLVLGDDLLCTQTNRIQRAIDTNAANALLLKVNQCGSITEAADAYKLAKSAGWHVTVSARSGETEDDWLADLAVGWQGDQIKIGSITQSERLAKYNRLLEIESVYQFPFC